MDARAAKPGEERRTETECVRVERRFGFEFADDIAHFCWPDFWSEPADF